MNKPTISTDERRSRFELRTLLETSRLLIESQDPDFVLNNLLLITMGKLLVPKGMILIHKPGDASYLVSKSKGRDWLKEDSDLKAEFDQKLLDTSVIQGEKYAAVFDAIGIERESTLFNLKTSGLVYLSCPKVFYLKPTC